MMQRWFFGGLFLLLFISTKAQPSIPPPDSAKSVARIWMEVALEAVSNDGNGPTVHARNFFHIAIAMYDAWAVFDKKASTYLLGKKVGNYTCPFDGFELPKGLNVDSAREVAISYAAYRIIRYRFNLFGSKNRILDNVDARFESMGFQRGFRSQDYSTGNPAALGNYIGDQVIQYGLQDGAKEVDLYEARFYHPINVRLKPNKPGNPLLKNPNNWQPLSVRDYVEGRGGDKSLEPWLHILIDQEDIFLTPEWGEVTPFAMDTSNRVFKTNEVGEYQLWHDPGPPPYIVPGNDSLSRQYKWNFVLVALWASHMSLKDNVMMDISPASFGNAVDLPETYEDYANYYLEEKGGVVMKGHKINPFTKEPYKPNLVPRGDYTRVIAEYWVDAAGTYTPPGHWIQHLHITNDGEYFVPRWEGKGKELPMLEWDIKSQFAMAGAMHDAGIAAWSAKGYYDFIRPISALRWMSDNGQCSDPNLPRYHPDGIPLVPGHIELVTKKDPLVGEDKENLNKIKVLSWRGPEYIQDPDTDAAGVDWILMENWWPYQRFSFVTPPFAGYVSGHSTFSKAGAEVLTLMMGNPFFPGGMLEFTAKKNEFLEFEEGPSQDITLQWATFHDAADQTCLSRIWGGIHPPCDDIQGRKMGLKIGRDAFKRAEEYFDGKR